MTQITVNGKSQRCQPHCTVAELLSELGMTGKPVVVELDGRALTPAEHQQATLKEGSTVEIIALAAGG